MRRLWLLCLLLVLTACSGPKEKPSISLYLAIQRGDLNQIERHIAWNADLNAPLPDGLPPLHMAAAAGRVAISRLLIERGADANGLDTQSKTPLYRALERGRTQVAEQLLKQGAKLDAAELLRQLLQAQTLDRDVVAFLQNQGANLNQLHQGRSLLGDAIRLNNLQLCKLLIRAGADVNLAETTGTSPLQLATASGNADIIRLLQQQGAKQLAN
ncbi:MAG: ankyrin repeat domain-containing protein [Gammaproteobacteria bacterium]|nr:ankyrin repeat domain-containing protein [Gammaproteobacteria bacterium]